MDDLDPIDIEIGVRVREARSRAGMTQRELGERIGVTSQQVQKYEAGRSRMAVSMLCRVAEAVGAAPAALVGGLLGEAAQAVDSLAPRERELVDAYRALKSDEQRSALLGLVRTLPGTSD